MKSLPNKLNESVIIPKSGEVYLVSFDSVKDTFVKIQYVETNKVIFKNAELDKKTGMYIMLTGEGSAHEMTKAEFREIVIKKVK